MLKKQLPTIVMSTGLALLALLLVLGAGPGRGMVAAQDVAVTTGSTTEWTTSAEPPAGLTTPAYSVPDNPAGGQLRPDAPDALTSYRIAGAALKPRENDVSYTIGTGGACTYVVSGDTSTVWNAAVWLPQGAVVDTLRMYYYDTSGNNSVAWFTIYDLYGGIVNEWSVSSSGNTGNGFFDTALINHEIDYNTYSYLLNWRPVASGSTLQLCGFRIFYEPPPFGLNFLPTLLDETTP
ncbi:MAG: hypothetical protein KDE29_00290 [Anaerolineales bacterium]|nr:hypothetical protein [Anaerolineales bacterium]